MGQTVGNFTAPSIPKTIKIVILQSYNLQKQWIQINSKKNWTMLGNNSTISVSNGFT